MLCVVEMLTTAGNSLSARSATEAGPLASSRLPFAVRLEFAESSGTGTRSSFGGADGRSTWGAGSIGTA